MNAATIAPAIQLTPVGLARALHMPLPRAQLWAPHINAALRAAEINTPRRCASFLAQVGHESGSLRYVREIWGPTTAQLRYERQPDALWPQSREQARTAQGYTNRLAWTLGNSRPGDGRRYMGRGLIQVTGRTNYRAATQGLRAMLPDRADEVPDFEALPMLLEAPEWAALSAADYWRRRGLNEWADKGQFTELTRRINGGTNGLADRQAKYASAIAALRTMGDEAANTQQQEQAA